MSPLRPTSEPAVIVIFGASGDLTQSKLVPALHSLACAGLLPDEAQVLGVARSEVSDEEFRERLAQGVRDYARLKPGMCEVWPRLASRHTYLSGEYDDEDRLEKAWREMSIRLQAATDQHAAMTAELEELSRTPPDQFTLVEVWGLIRAIKVQGRILQLYIRQPAVDV